MYKILFIIVRENDVKLDKSVDVLKAKMEEFNIFDVFKGKSGSSGK